MRHKARELDMEQTLQHSVNVKYFETHLRVMRVFESLTPLSKKLI